MDKTELSRAVREHGDTVYRVALNLTASPSDAEDVAQTVFLRLWERKRGFESGEHMKFWLIRVAVNECKKLLRSPRRRGVPLEEAGEVPCPAGEENRAVWEAVTALPEQYRLAVYLHYFEGYTTGEIARMTGTTASTVQTRLARARERLRVILKEENDV